MPKSSTGITIDMKIVGGGDFNDFIDSAIKPVDKLNRAVIRLTRSLDDLNDAAHDFKAPTKAIKKFSKLVSALETTGTKGRGSLENLSRTAGVIETFLLTTGRISSAISRGTFKDLSKFGKIMNQFSKALASMDKIKRPENLLVALEGVKALKKMVKAISTGLPRTNIIARQINGLSRLKPFARMLANALKEFDKIERPRNLKAAVKGIDALRSGIILLGRFDFNIIDRINRRRLLGQLTNVAKQLSKAFQQFDKIKRPERIDSAAKGIRSLTQLMEQLRKISKMGQRLSNAGIKGFFTQAGTLISGLGKLMRLVSKNLKGFAKFSNKQVASLEAVGKVINGIVKLLRLIQTEASILTSKEGVSAKIDRKSVSGIADLMEVINTIAKSLRGVGDVNPEQVKAMAELIKVVVNLRQMADTTTRVDTSGLRETVKDLLVIAKDISKVRFDPAKVSAIAQFYSNLDQALSGGGAGRGGRFSSAFGRLTDNAKKAASVLVNVFTKAATTIGRAFKNLFTKNPFLSLVKSARNAAKSVIGAFSNISQSMRNFGREMTQLGTQMLIGGGIAGFIQSQGVQMTMEFESIMKQIEVLGDITGKELEQANELILQLGESSVFSASEVASSVLELSKAGLSFQDISLALEDILNLAAAGGIAIDDASTLVIQAVGAFDDLTFGDATKIVDTFVAAANIGTATVADLSAAFGFVSNTANTFGQDLEMVTAALTLMMDRGIEGSRAGRSLDAFMRSLIKPSAEASEAIGQIEESLISANLIMGDATLQADSQGNFRDLNEILGLISITTKDMNEAGRAAMLTQISGSANAGRALLSLLSMYEDGTLVLDEYIEKQEDSASAAEVGAALMDTTAGSIEEMSGAFETLLLKALDPVLEYGIRPLIDGITWIIRQVSKLPQPILAAAAGLTGLSTVLITLTGAFLIFGGVITQLIGFALVPLVGVLTALINPVRFLLALTAGQGIFMVLFAGAALIIPLILGVVGAIRTLRKGFEEFPFFLEGIALGFNNMRDAAGSALESVFKVMSTFFSALFGGAGGPDVGVLVTISNSLTFLFRTITEGLSDLQEFASIMDVVLTAVGNLGVNLDAMFISLFKVAEGNSIFEAILGEGFSQGAFTSWLTEIVFAILDFRSVLASTTQPIIEFFNAISEGGLTGDAFVDLFTGLGSVGAQAAGAFLEVLERVFNTSFGALPDLLRTGNLSKIFKTLGVQLIESLALGMISKAGFITNIFASIFDKIFGTNIAAPIKKIFKELERSLKIAFSLIKKIFGVFGGGEGGSGGKGAVAVFIENILGGVADALEDINRIFEIFDILVEKVDLVTGLAFLAREFNLPEWLFGGDIMTVKATMEEVAQGFSRIAEGVQMFFFAIKDLITGDISLATALEEMFAGLTEVAGGASGIALAIGENIKAAFEAIDWAGLLSDATFSLADLLGLDLTEEDKAKIEESVENALSFVGTVIDNTIAAIEGPGTDLVETLLEDIAAAIEAISEADSETLAAVGIALGGVVAVLAGPAIAAAAAPLLLVAGGFIILKGALRGLPDLLDAIDLALDGDWEGAWDSFKSAAVNAWDGMKDAALSILDFIATILGFDDIFSQENYDAGVEAWKGAFNAIGAIVDALIPRIDTIFDKIRLRVLEVAADITEAIEEALSFEAVKVGGKEIIGAQTVDLGSDKLREDANALALEIEQQEIMLKFGIDQESVDTALASLPGFFDFGGEGDTATLPVIEYDIDGQVDAWNAVTEAIIESLPEEGLQITGEDMIDTTSVAESTALATGSVDTMTSTMMSNIGDTATSVEWLDKTISAPPDTSLPIQAVEDMSMSVIEDIEETTESVQTLKDELATMWDVSVVVTFIAPDGAETILPPEAPGRALGGPVFANQLYEVAENGISELLEIGGKTFLIPGTNGVVVPPETVNPALTPNDEFRARSGRSGSSTVIYEDNSTQTIEINGSGLSPDELEGAVTRAIDKNNQERSRSVQQRLMSVGRNF
jgi:TP901 family phage tail tape measure protein